MQHTAIHCNTLQHTATQSTSRCNALHTTFYRLPRSSVRITSRNATQFNTLQHNATQSSTHCNTICNTLQHNLQRTSNNILLTVTEFGENCKSQSLKTSARALIMHTATHCNTHCNTLQYTTTNCSTLHLSQMSARYESSLLQHTATHCNTLENDQEFIFCIK